MAFKMKYSSPLNLINEGKKGGGRMSEEEAAAVSANPDMEVEISASTQTVPRGYGVPTPGSANVDKVVERKSKRKFGDVALSPKEKQGAKGTKWAKSREFSKQSVKFN